jgi:hypothetical protein
VTRLRCSDGLDLVSYGSIWLVTLALTIPSLSLGLVEVMLVALELLDIGYGGNSSDQFSSASRLADTSSSVRGFGMVMAVVSSMAWTSTSIALGCDIFRYDCSTSLKNQDVQHRINGTDNSSRSTRYVYLLDSPMRLAPNALVSTTNFLDFPPCVTSGIAAYRIRPDTTSGIRHPSGLGYA